MTEKNPPSLRPPMAFASSWAGPLRPLKAADVQKLATDYGLDVNKLSEALRKERGDWALNEQSRRDVRDTALLMKAIVKAKELHALWERLSDGMRDSIFAYRDANDPGSVLFGRGLAYLAQEGESITRRWPTADSGSRVWPRDALVRRLQEFWLSEKGEVASASGSPSVTGSNDGAKFVQEAVHLITGAKMSPDRVRDANPARKGKKRAKAPEISP